MPVLTRAGCNGGVCHAKAGGGQNGFQLSLLGFEAADDYEHLVKEGRGRRVSLAMPEQSLFLMNTGGGIPHGGGVRFPPASEEFLLLARWVGEGATFDRASDPRLTGFVVQPPHKRIAPGGSQQLQAVARYSDGSVRDVTCWALYETNDPAMAEVSNQGLVKILNITGNVSIMVRFQGQVAVFSAAAPPGAHSAGPVHNATRANTACVPASKARSCRPWLGPCELCLREKSGNSTAKPDFSSRSTGVPVGAWSRLDSIHIRRGIVRASDRHSRP